MSEIFKSLQTTTPAINPKKQLLPTNLPRTNTPSHPLTLHSLHNGLFIRQAIRHEAGPRGSEPRQRPRPHRKTPGKLLREMRPQARHLPLQQRTDVHDVVHGKVHGRLEPGQRGVHQPDTTGAGQQLKNSHTKIWKMEIPEQNNEILGE